MSFWSAALKPESSTPKDPSKDPGRNADNLRNAASVPAAPAASATNRPPPPPKPKVSLPMSRPTTTRRSPLQQVGLASGNPPSSQGTLSHPGRTAPKRADVDSASVVETRQQPSTKLESKVDVKSDDNQQSDTDDWDDWDDFDDQDFDTRTANQQVESIDTEEKEDSESKEPSHQPATGRQDCSSAIREGTPLHLQSVDPVEHRTPSSNQQAAASQPEQEGHRPNDPLFAIDYKCMDEQTLRRRTELESNTHDLMKKIAYVRSRLAIESMERNRSLVTATATNVFKPLAKAFDDVSLERNRHRDDESGPRNVWRKLEGKLSTLDSKMTHCLFVELHDAKRELLDKQYDYVTGSLAAQSRSELAEADKRERNVFRSFEELAGTTARLRYEQCATEAVQRQMRSRDNQGSPEAISNALEDTAAEELLLMVKDLRLRVANLRADREANGSLLI